MKNKIGITKVTLINNRKYKMKTKCYTYEVTMTVQVLADDETTANLALDEKGGYVSDRKTKLIKTTDLGTKIKSVKE
jgi:hypothetical protein